MSPDLNQETIARIEALKSLSHPNIADTQLKTYPNGETYLVETQAEYPLSNFIDRLPINSRLFIASQLCQTLEMLHDLLPYEQAYHGNLSMDAIKLTADGDIKLCNLALNSDIDADQMALNEVVKTIIGNVDREHPAHELLEALSTQNMLPFQMHEALIQMVVGNDLEVIKDNLSIRNLDETNDNHTLLQSALTEIKNRPEKWLPESASVFDDDSGESVSDLSASLNDNYGILVDTIGTDIDQPSNQAPDSPASNPSVIADDTEAKTQAAPAQNEIESPYDIIASDLQTHASELLPNTIKNNSNPEINLDSEQLTDATSSTESGFQRHKAVEEAPFIDWQAEMMTPLSELESQMEPIEAEESPVDPNLFSKAEPHFIGQRTETGPLLAGPAPDNFEGDISNSYPQEALPGDPEATVLNMSSEDFLKQIAQENATEASSETSPLQDTDKEALLSILDGHEFESQFNFPDISQLNNTEEAAQAPFKNTQTTDFPFDKNQGFHKEFESRQPVLEAPQTPQPQPEPNSHEQSPSLSFTETSNLFSSDEVIAQERGRHSSFREELQSRFASTLRRHGLTNDEDQEEPSREPTIEDDATEKQFTIESEESADSTQREDNTLIELPTFHSQNADISLADLTDSLLKEAKKSVPKEEPSADERVNALIDLYASGIIDHSEYLEGIQEMTQLHPERYPELEAELERGLQPVKANYQEWVQPTKDSNNIHSKDSFLGEQASEIDSLGISIQESELDSNDAYSASEISFERGQSEEYSDALSHSHDANARPSEDASFDSQALSDSDDDSDSDVNKPFEKEEHNFHVEVDPEEASVEEGSSFFNKTGELELPDGPDIFVEEAAPYIVPGQESKYEESTGSGGKTTVALIAGAFVIGAVSGELISPGESFLSILGGSDEITESLAVDSDQVPKEDNLDLSTMTTTTSKTDIPDANQAEDIGELSIPSPPVQIDTKTKIKRINKATPLPKSQIVAPIQSNAPEVRITPQPVEINAKTIPQQPAAVNISTGPRPVAVPTEGNQSTQESVAPTLSITKMKAAPTLEDTSNDRLSNPNLSSDASLKNDAMNVAKEIPATTFELSQPPTVKDALSINKADQITSSPSVNEAPPPIDNLDELDLDANQADEAPPQYDEEAFKGLDEERPLIDSVADSNENSGTAAVTPSSFEKPSAPESTTPSQIPMSKASTLAIDGQLSETTQNDLLSLTQDDENYDRANSILLMNAQRLDDEEKIRTALNRIMKNPSNRTNPVFLTSLAHSQVNMAQFNQAAKTVKKAKTNFMKTPSNLKTTLYAELIEIEAAAAVGAFYRRPKDTSRFMQVKSLLEKCIDYANAISDPKMAKRAQTHLNALLKLTP